MKKSLGLIFLLVSFFVIGFVLIDSALAEPDQECMCRDWSDQWAICTTYCSQNNYGDCTMTHPDPKGTCSDYTCYTLFTFWCEEGGGRSISGSEYCIDCY